MRLAGIVVGVFNGDGVSDDEFPETIVPSQCGSASGVRPDQTWPAGTAMDQLWETRPVAEFSERLISGITGA
jgi:hypothetical protein